MSSFETRSSECHLQDVLQDSTYVSKEDMWTPKTRTTVECEHDKHDNRHSPPAHVIDQGEGKYTAK